MSFNGKEVEVISLERALELKPHVALFSAGGTVSKEWAPKFSQVGTTVIDNSSAWRMEEGVKLVIPEVNGDVIEDSDMIIANPNCSTMQLLMVLKPLPTGLA